MRWTVLISIVGTVFLLINVLLYFKSFAKESKAFKFFTIYLCSMLVIQIIMTYFVLVIKKQNLFLSHFYFISQFILLSLFYERIIGKKYLRVILYSILFLLCIQYYLNPQLISQYNSLGIGVTQSLLILYSILYLAKSLKIDKIDFLIINVGLLIYLIVSVLVFVAGNLSLDLNIPKKLYRILIYINLIFYIIFQTLIFIEWRKNYYKKTLRS